MIRRQRRFSVKRYAVIACLLLLPQAITAQSNTGSIRGVVTDKTGAVVANARLQLGNAITRYTQTAISDNQGAYRLPDVPLNDYTLTIEAPGFETTTRDIRVRSNLAQQVDVQLGVVGVRQEVDVQAARDLLEAEKAAPTTVLDRNWILRFPTSQPSRSAAAIIGTAPGWTEDANGRLHARGLEAQIQYSIDGIPVTDTIADIFASAPDPRNFRSVEISTAYLPAEYGNKLAGVIAVTSRSGRGLPTQGSVTLSGGSFSTFETSFDVGGHAGKFGYFASAAGSATGRFLDPPTVEDFHNRGSGIKSFVKLDYEPDEKNLFRLSLFANQQRFDVPNLLEQEISGQDQRRRGHDTMLSLTWEHIFSQDFVGQMAAYHRYNQASLLSNAAAVPVFAEQSRHHASYGLLGSLTFHKQRHTIKTGFEFIRFPVRESFTIAITDLEGLLEREPGLPEAAQGFTLTAPFVFNERRAGWEASVYAQDHINAARNLTIDVGLRFDSYHFLVDKNYLSPRLGAAYLINKTRTVLRAAYNRFLQTPVLENLLLSSSEQARVFSPGSVALATNTPASSGKTDPVRPSREWQVDLGFQQQLGRYVRLDADVFYRRMTNPAEFTSFLDTGIVFPATLASSRSKGVEARLDLSRVGGWSGFVSYTNLHIYGFAPLTGGLFLGEAVDLSRRAGQRVNIEEDQRNTAAFQLMYDRLPKKIWAAFGGRHDSGYSIELDEVDANDLALRFPAKILNEVNFVRGFIKPHSVFDFAVGRDFALTERLSLAAQFNIQNLADRFYLIIFDSLSSGVAIGRPRSYSSKLTLSFK
jgi:TonB dependent receptor/Carboxypeptidase regulatory-like domain